MEQGPPIQDPLVAERIASALKKADAAGDVEGAKKLAAAYREAIAKTQQPVAAPVLPGKPPASPVTASPSTSVVGSGVGTPSGAGQTIQLAKPLPKLDRFGVPEINVVQQEASAIQQAAPQMLKDAATAARDAADYHRLYGGLNEAEAKAQREQAAAIAHREIAGMKQGFDADHAQLEFAQTELDAKGRRVQELEQTDPIAAQQARQEFQQMANDYNGMVGSLEKQQKAIVDLESGANRELEMGSIRERNIRATRGSKVGALYNELLLGTGDAIAGLETGMTLGLLSMVPEAAVPPVFGDAPGTTKDQVLDRVRKDLMPALREAPYEMAASEGTTKEYSDKWREGFWGGSLLGLARSVPGMATPMMSGIGFQVLDGTMREMEDSPEFDDISASEKMAVALPLSAISMALEKFGFRNLASNKSVLKSIFRETLDMIPQDASVEQMQRIIDGNVKSAAGRYLMRMGTAGAAEFETGSTQEGLDSGLKELYNEARSRGVDDRGRFRTHDGWLGYAKEMIKAGAQESVGAIFLGQPYAISQALRKNKVGELASPQEFELVEESLKDPNYTREAEAHIDERVAKGLITEVQADEVKSDWATARKVRDKIPDDLPTIVRREAFDILSQMEALKSKDPILVAGKMEALKERLRKLPGIDSEPLKKGADGEVKKPFTVEPTGGEVMRVSSLTTEGPVRPEGAPKEAGSTAYFQSNGFAPKLKPNGDGEFILQVDDTNPDGKRSVGSVGLKTVEVNGKRFLSIIMTNVREGYEGKGLGTNMYRYLMEHLPEGHVGILSPKETRWNKEQIPAIHEKLSKDYAKTTLDNGDVVFSNPSQPPTDAATPASEAATEVVAPPATAEEVQAIESASTEVAEPELAATGTPWSGSLMRGTNPAFPKRDEGDFGPGVYWTSDPEIAGAYSRPLIGTTGPEGKVINSDVSLSNPLVFGTVKEAFDFRRSVVGGDLVYKPQSKEASEKMKEAITGMGHDGVIIYDGGQERSTITNTPIEVVSYQPNAPAQTPTPAHVPESAITEPATPSGEVLAPEVVEPTTEPLTIFKGVKGKVGPNGERISAHEGVEGVFGSLDQSVSEKYKGEEPLKRFDIPAGTTVGTVEVDVKGKSVDEYRAEEVKAINASPTQVVKLITLDSGKGTKQEQYIIKDKGLIDSATDVVSEPPPPTEPPVTTPTEKPEPTEPERLMRAQAKRIKNEDPELFEALNLDDNTVYYDRFPNVVSEAAAAELIGYLGNSKSEAHITDPRKKIPGAVRVQMYKALKKQYYKEKDYDAAKRLIDTFAPLTTEAGQFTQALYDKEDFAEGRAVMQAMEVVGRQLDKKEERDKQHKKIKKGLREANKQVVEEVLSTVKVKSRITNASTPDQGPEPQNKPHFGTKNKLFTKERKDAAWKAMMSRTAGAIIQPEMVVIAGYYIEGGARSFAEVAEKVVKRGGKKLLPYLKGAYEKAAKELGVEPSTDAEVDEFIAKSNTDKVVARLNKAIEKKDKKAQAKAIAELQQVAKDTGLWGTYKQEAVDRLRRLGDQAIKEDVAENPPLADFTNGLLKNLTAQMREEAEAQGKEEPEPKKRRKDIEVIGDAFKNFEKYEDVWKQTQNEFKGRLRAAEARLAKAETPAAKEEAGKAVEREEARLASLDAYFGELMPKPFSEAGLGRAVKEGMKDLDQKVDTIIRQHYTVYDSAKRSLQDKLVQEAGINETQAKELSDAVGKEFDRLATDRKKRVIEKYISKKSVKDRKVKGIEDDLITLTNTGAFSDDQFIEKYGEMMGWPSLTKENIQEIERLADRIQTSPEGRPREEAIADLLGYQANLAGVSKWDLVQSIWYANMLSGFQTQEVNALANVAQVASELFIGELRAATRVKGGKGRRAEMAALLNAVGYGLKRGANEAGSTIRTGYSPIRGKVEIPPTLERISFKGGKYSPGNYAKYVRRVMVAADVLFFEAARELRAEQLAQLQARSSDPSDGKRQEALDIMNRGDDAIRNAKDQAHEEYEKEAADIKAKGLTPDQEKKALKKAVADEKRRVFELVEKRRPANIKEDAAKFAARVTYNYKPEGTLGAAAEGINTFLRLAPPFRYIIPFVNIIANVANETLNYTPVGYLRALSEGSLLDATKKAAGMDPNSDHFTEEQKKQYRADLIAKASVGMALVAAAMVLSDPGDDDDPIMEITANGFGDWKKNRALEETKGWQQYSIKIGDKWISYQYTPVATVLSMIGHYRDAQKYRAERIDDDELANLSVAAWRSGSTFMDATMLGTLKDVLGAARGEEEGWRGKLAMSATRIAKGMVVPALYTQAARAVEAANESPMKDVRENPLGYLSQDIPVVRDAQFNRLNWLGEPVIPEGGVLPRFVSVEKSEPAAELIGHYGWNPSIPSFKKVYDPETEKDRVTTKQEQYDFMRIRGQYLKNEITTRFDELMGLEKAEFLEEMKLIQSDATYEAKSQLGLDQ